MAVNFNVFFMFRRICIVYIIVILIDYPFFVCQFLMIFSTMNFIYLTSYRPYKSRKELFIEIFNEGCILIVSHMVNMLLNDAIPIDFKDALGWTLMSVVFINIFVNLTLIIRMSIYDIMKAIYKKRSKKLLKKTIEKKIENRKFLASNAPGTFKRFEKEISIYEAI